MSIRTVQEWCSRGVLPASKIGHKFIIDKQDIDQILEKNKNTKK
jgi:excisionase family DNA binding protein